MKKDKTRKKRVNISKISHANGKYLFWYDVDGANRKIVRGNMKFVDAERDLLIKKYKNDILIIRK